MTENNAKLLKRLSAALTVFILALFLVNMHTSEGNEEKTQRETAALTYFENFSLRVFDRSAGTAGAEMFTQEELKAYKVTVFNGWGPWCTACVNEMPELNGLFEEYEEKGLLLTGVVPQYNSDSAANGDEAIAKVLEALDIRYPILLGDDRFVAEAEPTMGGAYPGTWAVDAEGHVLGFVSGARDEAGWRAQFDTWLSEARQ